MLKDVAWGVSRVGIAARGFSRSEVLLQDSGHGRFLAMPLERLVEHHQRLELTFVPHPRQHACIDPPALALMRASIYRRCWKPFRVTGEIDRWTTKFRQIDFRKTRGERLPTRSFKKR